MARMCRLLVLLLSTAAGLAAQDAKVSFLWAFVRHAANGSPASVDFSDRVDIKPGDLFKIHIRPAAGTYVYLILQDSSDEVQMLFPESFDAFETPSYAKTGFFLPEGDDWFSLDAAKGTERFHLLASSQRLRPLESIILSYRKTASNAKSTVPARNAARQAVLDELKRIVKEHSQLVVAAEKPVTIAGGTRGTNDSVATLATRIEAAGFYVRTFRMEH
jgi:hypothetical protein